MGIDEHVCPACEQPVATVVRRRKTLGAFVPVWGPGPCHNPRCEASAESASSPRTRDLQEAGAARWPRDPRDPGKAAGVRRTSADRDDQDEATEATESS
ncbi:hypothetical protein ACFVTC_39725 [Streptomyces sp. NPDC057950]|uniref:hypothetical protein n=1 Tax=Streptomyces sp. NPDC057950 TaxID=3346288 RepID=UPI0036ED8619